LFNVEIDLLLSPLGGRHKAVQPREIQEETHQAHAARPDCDADHMEGNHDAVSERQSGTALKELGDMGTYIKGVVPYTPGLQGRARHLELLGGLTFGDALGSQLPILLKEVRTCESIPAWLTLRVALWLVLDYGSHVTSLLNPSPAHIHG
jgi:hypothetical protein